MAVYVSNIDVAWHDTTPLGLVRLTRETTTDSFSFGDLCDSDAADGTIDVVGDADKGDFVGVSLSTVDGAIDDTSKVMVAIRAIIRAPLKSGGTQIWLGEAGAWVAGANGTTWYLDNTVTQSIAHCMSETITATNYGLWAIDAFTLRAVDDLAFFEVPS